MYLPEFELHEAGSTEEAIELLTRHAPDAKLLAGGTDLLVDLRTGRVSTGHMISLNKISDLRGVAEKGKGLWIGALTTVTRLVGSSAAHERYPAILDAASKMASLQIRNLATVGGNIASGVPCADLPPILIVMNASVTLKSSEGERIVPLDTFFTGPRQTALTNHEVLTDIHVPRPPPTSGSAYTRFNLRDGNAVSVAGVAAGLWLNEDGTIRGSRIAMGAVAPIPKYVPSVSDLLDGETPSEEIFAAAANRTMEAAEPISDVRGSADFRRELVGVLTRRALDGALARAKGVTS
jgi:carbon-monoxide dehydrogenase medium subunit